MGLLERGRAALIRRMQSAAAPAGALTYIPSSGAPVDLTGKAWVGRTVFVNRLPTQRGPAVEFGERDYLIPVAELPGEPAKGDRVTEVIDGATLTFEVLPTGSEPAWRYSDAGRTVYRVHTKRVQT